jgi:hypothetical protein
VYNNKKIRGIGVTDVRTELVFVDLLGIPGIDSQPGGIDSLESIPGLYVYKFGLSIQQCNILAFFN